MMSEPTPAKSEMPASEKSLGQRLFSRINDLIAISILLFAGISMGGAVIEWWNTSPEDAHTPNLRVAADDITPPDFLNGAPVRIDAGDLNVRMERSEIEGSSSQIQRHMIEKLSKYAASVSLLAESPGEEELSMLRELEKQQPVWSDEKGAAVFHQDAPLGAYVAVRKNSTELQKASQFSGRRVVSWGLVVPSGKSRWTAWLFAPRPGGDSPVSSDWRSVLPSGAICNLGLQSKDGQLMLAFSGTGSLDQWKREFGQSLESKKFQQVETWVDQKTCTFAEFESTHGAYRQQLTIHIQDETRGRLRGLMHVTRPREETP
jgi:hypothetical protein